MSKNWGGKVEEEKKNLLKRVGMKKRCSSVKQKTRE